MTCGPCIFMLPAAGSISVGHPVAPDRVFLLFLLGLSFRTGNRIVASCAISIHSSFLTTRDVPRGILAIPLGGGAPVRICSGLCVVRWSLDGKSMFFSVFGGSQGHLLGWGTSIVPLAPGQMFPKLPSTGVASKADAAALPGAKPLDAFVLPGQNETIYAFSRTTVHRNLFRIPLP